MLKKGIVILVAVLIILAIIGLLLPRNIHVERSVTIARPASLIYATVNSFQLFPKWSPWQNLDPNMRQSAEGARARPAVLSLLPAPLGGGLGRRLFCDGLKFFSHEFDEG